LVSDIFFEFKAFLFTVRVMNPFRRVSYFRVNILEVNREVDNVKIKVFESEIRQGSLDSRLNMFRSVESVPELRHDEEVFALNNPSLKYSLDSFTSLLFIAIISGTVEESVASFNSVDDCIRA